MPRTGGQVQSASRTALMGLVGPTPGSEDLGKARRTRSSAVRFSAASVGLFSILQAGPVTAQSPVGSVDYREQVHPILAANCLSCHDQEKRSGGLALATYDDVLAGGRSGPAVKPGQSAESLLISRLRGEIEPQMPLGGVLGSSQIDTLRAWIDEGARPAPEARPAAPPFGTVGTGLTTALSPAISRTKGLSHPASSPTPFSPVVPS